MALLNWTLSPGDVLAHYRVISPLGSGGMGQVFLAEDTRLGRKLALKVLATERRLGRAGSSGSSERLAASRRSTTPTSSRSTTRADSRGLRFIATEFIEGVTLRTLLDRGRLDVRQSLDIATQVAQALAAAHAAGVVHRDLKPENVMVRADGYVKVLDFGLAKLTGILSRSARVRRRDARVLETAAGVVMGTVRYMAPEQARGEEIDARADVFALGVVLYEMLAGDAAVQRRRARPTSSARSSCQEPQPLSGRARRAGSHRQDGAAQGTIGTLPVVRAAARGTAIGAAHARLAPDADTPTSRLGCAIGDHAFSPPGC